MGVRVQVDLVSNFPQIYNEAMVHIVNGENRAAERLLALSSTRAPMDDDGTLVASGQVELATDATEGAGVVYDTAYAARWHADQALVDSLGRRYSGGSNFQNGRQSHYVEEPAMENKDVLGAIIAKG
ncbi:hypothetical protein [Mycetocola miduiensis]|uniref:Uncharacterized protein n=1 Tax=Mycetocola miduiensis TaxID=995034 RepID=A0A1I5AUP9_9MICO|nr:hypothetical protein [Mycetocola miduiensis]SFN66167.1 hypothetical protein SAMN05216219_1551 [Mycetocola miduiensis]